MEAMIKKFFDFLAGRWMTLISGVFLVASLILLLTDTEILIDPAWVTIFISGLPLLYLAIWRIIYLQKMRKISSALLISIAMIACIALSFSENSHDNLFAAGEVAFIMAIGALLEDKTVARAKKGIKKLISLMPQQGRLIIVDGKGTREEIVSVERIKIGDILRVFPGEAIPVDGEIIAGDTSIDQSIITGESLPIDKSIGDSVYCGTINRFGSIDIKVAKVGENSSLQKMINMVKTAEDNKAPMQRIVDKWAAWLVPIALLIAIGTYLITYSLRLDDSLIRAVTVLVVFCPCALALATPTSIVAAIGQATRHGVLIKSGEALENMGKVDCIAFDKTGTLTQGNLLVSDVIPLIDNLDKKALIGLAASVEARSEHPLGKAIVTCAKDMGVTLFSSEEFFMSPGKGIQASINGKKVFCGNTAFLLGHGISLTKKAEETSNILREQGKAVIIIAQDMQCIGVIALSDTIRTDAAQMIAGLNGLQTQVVLLTGDNTRTAHYLADAVGITNVYAELLPEDKVNKIQELQSKGKKVCMIGDGVNDAPALKTANIGVAMGKAGSDIAIDAADIALVGDDIAKIPYLKRLSNSTINTIKFNIILSMAINFAAITLSVLGVLNPITGALVHNAGSVLVVLNAALLYDRKFDKPKNSKIR